MSLPRRSNTESAATCRCIEGCAFHWRDGRESVFVEMMRHHGRNSTYEDAHAGTHENGGVLVHFNTRKPDPVERGETLERQKRRRQAW